MKKVYYVLLLTIFAFTTTNAQRTLIDEWEANIGYLNFQGDYGTRGVFSSTLPNSGGMIGGKVYFNLLDSENSGCYACKHLKFHVGFNTGYSVLSFSGVPEENTFPRLAAISGQIYFLNLGLNTEFHFNNLRYIDYFSNSFFNKLDPYVGAGVGFLAYGVDVDSALGNYEKNPSILPPSFVGNVHNGGGITPSFHLEAGLRYKFSDELLLSINNKWMYFLSDKVDGVDPDPTMVDNLHDDWMFSPSIGVVIFIW